MKTNLKAYNKRRLKRQLEADDEQEDVAEDDTPGYFEDLRRSENFEVGDYPLPWIRYPRFPGDRLRLVAGGSCVRKVYDSSHLSHRCPPIEFDQLQCFSRLAMAFYNIRMGTRFRVVKVLMTTKQPFPLYTLYVSFEAERNSGGSVTFQTKILVFNYPCPKIELLFVMIKPDHKSNNSPPFEFDQISQAIEERAFSQVINTYTIDSKLDSEYSLALYLSQYALHSHNFDELKLYDVAKHDIKSLKVLKLVKSDSEVPSYLITFEASMHAETEEKSVETFETKICMPTLFPTTTIELRSGVRVIAGSGDRQGPWQW